MVWEGRTKINFMMEVMSTEGNLVNIGVRLGAASKENSVALY